MALHPIVRRHLDEARRELVEQRDALNDEIENIDRMLTDPRANAGNKDAVVRGLLDDVFPIRQETSAPVKFWRNDLVHGGEGDGRAYPAIKDAIKIYLARQAEPVRTQEIAEKLANEYDWAEASIRSAVSRMARDGEVLNVRRGMYTVSDTALRTTLESLDETLGLTTPSDESKSATDSGERQNAIPPDVGDEWK